MNLVDKVISYFSPEEAYERMLYREAIRYYDAGEVNRFNDTWIPVDSDTENMDRTQRTLITARARWLERNDDIANAAVGAIVRNTIGSGIKPQAKTGDEGLNDRLEKLWKIWTSHNNCDITGQQDFYEIQAAVLTRKIYDGEIFIRKVMDKRANIPLKLQIIKADLLDTYMMSAPKSNRVIRSGIELDDYLKPLAYWLQKKSPDGYITYESERITAEQMLHLWTKKHPDQIRGISDLAPIITRLKDINEYLRAETLAAKLAACFAIFIKKDMKGNPAPGAGQKDKEGKPLEKIRPAMIHYLKPNESIETANPSRSITKAQDFIAVQQRIAGAGLGLSYELMSRDFNNSSFSSARQGHLEDRRTFEPIQSYMISHFCQPIWAEFVESCVLSGSIDIPDYFQNREIYDYAEWITPGWSWIDPEKEVKADIMALQNGGKTFAQWCAERGYDWREQLKQMAIEKAEAENKGLILAIHTPESVQAAQSNHKEETNENGKQK